jgi:hypothetical protein
MRKIISKHEEGKKKKRSQFIVGGILIFIMVSSLLGYAFQNQNATGTSSSNSTLDYNGIIFVNQNGLWMVGYGNHTIAFTYHPSQVPSADLTNLTKSITDFSGKPLYINSYDSSAESEIRLDLFPFASEISNAQLPPQNCENNFIIIQNGSSGIRQEQNCIFISGQGEDLIKLVDNILFKIFGIKQ